MLHFAKTDKVISAARKRTDLRMNQPLMSERRATATTRDPRWLSIVNRDRTADGLFYYSVKTIGVYCRPSCAARPPRPENVQFYSSREESKKAGFRTCKRCKPDGPALAELNSEKLAAACCLIEHSDHSPLLKELASVAGMSVYHFHRTLKAVTGFNPKEFAETHRSNRVRTSLKRSNTVTDAIYDASIQTAVSTRVPTTFLA